MKTNYSLETSLPAYHSDQNEKVLQENKVLKQIEALKHNACIKIIARNLQLPDAIVSARINDLITKGKVEYSEKKFKIEGYMRKIPQLKKIIIENQTELFN
jgi:predicted transcriptional regulator